WQRDWLQGPVLADQLSYWKTRLADAPTVLDLPTDHPHPPVASTRGASYLFTLPHPLSQALKALSQQESVSLFTTLAAAFQTLLSRYSGQQDVLLGTVSADRGQSETEDLIGFFVNTLVLRTDLSGNPPFRELLGRVREGLLQAQEHQDVPFEYLVKELQPDRSSGQNPFFQVMLVLEPLVSTLSGGWSIDQMDIETKTAKFDLRLGLQDRPEGLRCCFEYKTDLFEETTIVRMAEHWQTLLEGIVTHPEQQLSELPLLSEAERHQLLVQWNATATEYADPQCIHQLFETQVERTPDAHALAFENMHLTYRELNTKANQLAHFLQQMGVGPEVLVGLYMERSLEMMVALLGILKAGGAYVPLDPTFPTERLGFMLADAQVSVLVTQQSLVPGLPEHNAHIICMDTDWNDIARMSKANASSEVKGENAVYVIYTSGSTGKPKGVTIEHRHLANYLNGVVQRLDIPAGSSFATVSSLATDLGNTAIFPCLCTGGCLHVISRERAIDHHALEDYFSSHAIDCLKITPSHLAALVASSQTGRILPRKRLIIGGEAFSWEWVNKLQTLAPDCTIFNHYGPTETTVGVLTYRVQKEQGELSYTTTPMGRPIGNTQVYLLDKYQHPVPIGVPGELYIGGASVTRGYLNRPELTAEKFITNPFTTECGGRMYRTGDRARYLPDGNIEFLGRVDDQVKIRGFRIELGEIQAMLSNHPAVLSALVVVREDAPGEKYLVAYIVPHEGQTITDAGLQDYLTKQVPAYMVPSAFVLLEALPLTPNGKIDKRALPVPERTRSATEAFVAPTLAVHYQLQHIWEDLLGVKPIGMQDNFFSLGGHSLLAARMVNRIEQVCGKKLPLATLFAGATIQHLADALLKDEAPPSKEVADTRTRVVTVKAGGSRRPFFFLHGDWHGGGLYCLNLAEHLSRDQPFYTLEPYRFEGLAVPPTLEEMAAAHIQAMRAVQPEGPYLLGGWCNGALLAYEMARQLLAAGQTVALLVALDMGTPSSYRQIRTIITRCGKLLGLGTEQQVNWFLRYIYLRIPSFRKRTQEAASESKAGRKGLLHRLRHAWFPSVAALRYNWFGIYRWIVGGYAPGPYPGKLIFLWSNEADAGGSKWRSISGTQEIEEQIFPGVHVMYGNENLPLLAERLNAYLLEAQATIGHERA
nr:amino acid adenylation domain-containing protein [Ktedonobacteraceae bacterium]